MRQQIVVDVGDDGQLVPGLQFLQAGGSVGEWWPVADGLGEGVDLFLGRRKHQLRAELAHDLRQHLPVGHVPAALYLRLECTVELQDPSVREVASVLLDERTQYAQNTSFPVDERAVAVEGDDGELLEVEGHDGWNVPIGDRHVHTQNNTRLHFHFDRLQQLERDHRLCR